MHLVRWSGLSCMYPSNSIWTGLITVRVVIWWTSPLNPRLMTASLHTTDKLFFLALILMTLFQTLVGELSIITFILIPGLGWNIEELPVSFIWSNFNLKKLVCRKDHSKTLPWSTLNIVWLDRLCYISRSYIFVAIFSIFAIKWLIRDYWCLQTSISMYVTSRQ